MRFSRLGALLVVGSFSLAVVTSVSAQSSSSSAAPRPASALAPPAPREFRGTWVASVSNINWPSRRDLSVEQQKAEMIAILDRCVELRLNAVIFQVRPACDALYNSELEPWSEYLTGTQGKAPDPYYDPLEMWVEEAHKRGLELHCWFNPYRAKAGRLDQVDDLHVSKSKPHIVRRYGKYLWLDPGEPDTIQHSLDVFLDVVRRYNIDGVHMDDYFYPYQVRDENNRVVDFPDEPSWQRYRESGGRLSRADWRRENVNTFIRKLYEQVKAEKPWVKVGISPFGIWRPNNPPGIRGLDAYSSLYADSKKWLNEGWCDYFSPQLYWPIEGPQSFPALFNWWSSQNTARRHVWPGMSVGRHEAKEVLNQISITRRRPNPGVIHWSYGALVRKRDLCEALINGHYQHQALIPAYRWLDSEPPPRPSAVAIRHPDGSATVTIEPAEGEEAFLWAIWSRHGARWQFSVHPGQETEIQLAASDQPGVINSLVITAVDRCGNESPRLAIGLSPASGQ